MSASSDRNLLLGILALQLDFVTRDQLVAAMNAWVLDKTRPLDQLLWEQKALRDDTRALLAALVEKHLQIHAGDPQQSLAAVSSIGSLRRELESLADPEVEASLAIAASAKDPNATLSWSVGAATSAGQRFRVLRPHARGGLGQVSVALDNELNREVALKEILSHHADDPTSRSRFVLEAEITGGLEHPGIVPVYGLGQYADGRPFYAMRFIRGDSLKEAADRFHNHDQPDFNGVEFRQLLGRFIDVCNAVAYAHSRGVLHRDLKPGNIMLGKYGETLVVDWGLAKAQGRSGEALDASETTLKPSASDSAPTLMGVAVGTPAYMSPEQAAGRLNDLGPAADVYSLGATLYYVLTGRAPFEQDDVAATLRRVQNAEFLRPAALIPRVPAALEAICLKAMSREIHARYDSPQQLSDDAEAWLADEPVSAWREPWTYRLARWTRRRKTLAAAVLALLASTSLALAVIAAMVEHNRRELAREQQRTDIQRQEAIENFRLARSAVDEFYTQVSENKLLGLPGMSSLRKELLQGARRYYEQFVRADRDQPGLQLELARALHRLGNITTVTGDISEARENLKQAERAYRALSDSTPHNVALRHELAVCWFDEGAFFHGRGELKAAEQRFQSASTFWRDLPRAEQDEFDADRRIADCRVYLANVYHDGGRLREAEEAFLESLEMRRRRADAAPGDLARRFELAKSYHQQGHFYYRTSRLDKAEEMLQQAEAVWREFPSSLTIADRQVTDGRVLGEIFRLTNRPQQAEETWKNVLDQAESLRLAFPDEPFHEFQLLAIYNDLGRLYFYTNRLRDAEALFARAVPIQEKHAAAEPGDPLRQNLMAALLVNYGKVLRDLRRFDEGSQVFTRAKAILERLSAASPDQTHLKTVLARAEEGLARLYKDRGDLQPALDLYAQSEQRLRQAIDVDPSNVDARRYLRDVCAGRAELWGLKNRLADSLADWDQAIEFDSGEFGSRFVLGRASVQARMGREDEALRAIDASLQGAATGEMHFLAAHVVAAAAQVNAGQPDEPKRERGAMQVQRAMALLEQAGENGFFRESSNVYRLDHDPELEIVRMTDSYRDWRLKLAIATVE